MPIYGVVMLIYIFVMLIWCYDGHNGITMAIYGGVILRYGVLMLVYAVAMVICGVVMLIYGFVTPICGTVMLDV